jgi:hypothetical protein
MASAAEILRRLKSVSDINVLQNMVYVHIKANESILKDLKEEEYEMGDIRSNKTFSGYKNIEYAEQKHEQNPRAGFGTVDLINTGAFANSLMLKKPKGNKYLFGATDPKRNKLVKKYGDILGLQQQTFNDFQYVFIKDPFIADLKKIINKK